MQFSNKLVFLFYLLLAFAASNMIMALPLHRRGSSYSGDGTFYAVGLGSCGQTNSDSEMVAALSSSLMAGGENCGKKLTVTSDSGSVTVTAVDTCPSCATGDVDFSSAAFQKLGDVDEGRIPIEWSFA
ncbi:RlpA-like double-psi beta-barrel-protein domain-containing protein-containing protein [Zychaea mexicana]|uniref:RlpA-like double-psi beta-barrel-protein domain-containing protein-containing protein n=1 Tax=Zychaea mexicana TaxID=64656 RepID=UPI0022FEE783|nr:RlpA-like double-psi beta-barrel-protein domain-containing protein-containing protein [Zychaea mexicana]KAI9492581.1 RlpA-like double-psi beta-barrel-protein domain-containing protein-containing protein [Zychaea mexicana]